MEKIKHYKYIIIMVLAILAGLFYWFQLRPTAIRKECSTGNGLLYLSGRSRISDLEYTDCLRRNGLNE